MENKKLRWGVIGAGGIADRRTIPGMMLAENAELIAVMDLNPELTENIRKKYNAKRAYTSEEELLKDPEVDAVYIATPIVCHARQAKLAADYGKHILIEKPLAMTSEEGDEVVKYCESKGVKIAAGFMMRFGSHVMSMKKAVAEGKIGTLVSGYSQFTLWLPHMGMDLFIFSDNVSIEEELELKQLGSSLGKLVMGPDAGVAVLNGVALAAGSILKDGPIGIVAASGSGAQEVGCIIEKCGYGVSNLIGTGGRDLYPQIGGITMIEGIRRMENDPNTKVIVLVSKLADLGVMDKVLNVADDCKKPVVVVFLGSNEDLFVNHKVHATFSLEECALKAVELAGGNVSDFGMTDGEIAQLAKDSVSKLAGEKKFFRGLYCGGTFTEEALQYFSAHNTDVTLYSNLSNRYCVKLEDSEVSQGHAILDLGAEDFTAKAPHPVFDPSLRLCRLRKELEDPEVGVVLLDFITGPGVAADPISAFACECAKHPEIVFISTICGSYEDPQNVVEKEKLLKDAGVIVVKSNYQSAKLASAMMNELDRR